MLLQWLSNRPRVSEENEKVTDVFEKLSGESAQDAAALVGAESFLSDIDRDKYVLREREYTDHEKHFVRRKWWLAVAQDLYRATALGARPGLTYLTLPGYNRLDVALFLKHKLLRILKSKPDGSPSEIAVAGFEADPSKFGTLAARTPQFQLFGNAKIEDALVDTANKYYDELHSLFPFDIVNLDLTTSLTPGHEGPYSKTMASVLAVLKRQADKQRWALFLTFRNMPGEWEAGAKSQLLDNLQKNIDDYATVREAFNKIYKVGSAKDLLRTDEKRCLSQSVVKWLIDQAHVYNVQLDSLSTLHYDRYNINVPAYTICKFVIVFKKGAAHPSVIPTKGTTRQGWMDTDVVTCVTRHKSTDIEESLYDLTVSVPKILEEIGLEIEELKAATS